LQFGLFRVAISTYSETAFREAPASALIHRDYTQRGAVHVQWSEDQVEISSPAPILLPPFPPLALELDFIGLPARDPSRDTRGHVRCQAGRRHYAPAHYARSYASSQQAYCERA
jgi:hypothetical protein